MPRSSYSLSRYPRYPDNWEELRRAVLRRDNFMCANHPNCPDTPDAKILQAHHIIPLSLGGTNNMSNLKTLCRACHMKLHPHMQSSYEGAWDDEDDDDDYDYDIDITPTGGQYQSVRPYNATSWASGATSRKSSSDAKWGWGAAAFFIVVAWLFIRAQSNSPQASERVRLYDAVTVQTVGVKPPVYTGPSFRCPVQNELETGSSVRIYAWAVSEGETWYRAGDGRWITGDSVATADEGDAQRTRRYITLPDCWGTPTPTRRPTRAPVTPTPETRQNSPREQFRK